MTPAQRLQASREAITAQWGPANGAPPRGRSSATPPQQRQPSPDWWSLAENTLRTWWQRHPAHPVVQIAHPMLVQYARDKPLHLVGIAAGLGAATVLLKPWRHIPLGAALRAKPTAPDISALLVALLSQHASQSMWKR